MKKQFDLYKMTKDEACNFKNCAASPVGITEKESYDYVKFCNYAESKMRTLPQTGRVSITYHFKREISENLSKRLVGFALNYGFDLTEIEGNTVEIIDTYTHGVETYEQIIGGLDFAQKIGATEIVIA